MKKPFKPLVRFRVYPWKCSLYYLVMVWRTQKEMLDYRVSMSLPRLRDCQAHVLSYDLLRNGKKMPILGEIHFHRRRLGTEVITHETFHATAALMRRLKFDFASLSENTFNSKTMRDEGDREELVALVQGKLARTIVNRLYDLKLLR